MADFLCFFAIPARATPSSLLDAAVELVVVSCCPKDCAALFCTSGRLGGGAVELSDSSPSRDRHVVAVPTSLPAPSPLDAAIDLVGLVLSLLVPSRDLVGPVLSGGESPAVFGSVLSGGEARVFANAKACWILLVLGDVRLGLGAATVTLSSKALFRVPPPTPTVRFFVCTTCLATVGFRLTVKASVAGVVGV